MSKPTIKSLWAQTDVIDPTTGQNNKVASTTDQQNFGWYPYRKKPTRNVSNYNQYANGLWQSWLDTEIEPQLQVLEGAALTGVVDMSIYLGTGNITQGWSTLGAGSAGVIRAADVEYVDFEAAWTQIRDIVYLHLPYVWGERTASTTITGSYMTMLNEPTSWGLSGAQNAQMLFKRGNDDQILNGYISITGGNPLLNTFTEESLLGGTNDNYIDDFIFSNAGMNGGILRQTITLHGDDLGWPVIP